MSSLNLYKSKDNTITELKPLSDDEVNLIKSNASLLIDFQKHHALIEYVILNYKSISTIFVDKVKEIAQAESNYLEFPFSNFYLETNSSFLNFLSSARTFLDHMLTYIRREYSEQSEQYSFFKKISAEEFDTTFSYKFMEKMRNYVQHCGMPPLSYDLKTQLDYDNSIVSSSLIVQFSRDALLSNYDSWGTKVKPELQSQNLTFPAIPLINEYLYSLIKIYVKYTEMYYSSGISSAKDNLLSVIGEIDGYILNEYSFGKITPSDNGVNINISTIPTSLLEKVYHFNYLQKLIYSRKDEHYIQFDEI